MFNDLTVIDHSILKLINQSWTNSLFDIFFPFITDLHRSPVVLFVILPVAFLFCLYCWRIRFLVHFLGLIFCIAFVDWTGGQFIKPFFERLRPNVLGLEITLRAVHYNGFSFISNHAANAFAVAAFVCVFSKRWSVALFLIAGLIAYSRVYCGVHFPSDVIAGALYGIMIGYLFGRLTLFLQSRFYHRFAQESL